MKWIAFGSSYERRDALYVNVPIAGNNQNRKMIFCTNYTRRDSRVGSSRRSLEGRREKTIRAVHMRPQAQPLAGFERDFLRREQLGA